MADQKLRVDIIGDASKLNRALTTASGKLQSFGSKVSGIGKRLAVGLTLPLGIAGGAAIKMASDFEESMNKVDQVRQVHQVDPVSQVNEVNEVRQVK